MPPTPREGSAVIEFFTPADMKRLANPGVVSLQIISPHHSSSKRVTITHVTVDPGHGQPRHSHAGSEQIWIALEGSATLLLADGATKEITKGDAARFAEGDIHGVQNTTGAPFVYMAVTAPPINFDYAYANTKDESR
jgi:quercetin dioxygenase-like cupin family protein